MTAIVILLLSAPPATDTRARIVVQIEDEALAVPETLLNALRLRLRRTEAATLAGEGADERPSDWRVVVSRQSRGQLYVRVSSPRGEIILGRNLVVAGRQPAEAAHTLALLIVEALTPVMPELLAELPTAEPVGAATATGAPAPREPARWSWEAGISTAMTWPASAVLVGARVALAFSWEQWLVAGDLVGWSPQDYRASDLHLVAWQGTARVAGGIALRLECVELSATLGPAMRLAVAQASGIGVKFQRRVVVEPGLGARGGVRLPLGSFAVIAGVDGYHYLEHARFVVDRERAIDLGSWAGALSLAISGDI